MALDPSAVDAELINGIFRAAHSIKGGSATFGFSVVADFTHVLETLLDEIRDGRRAITQDHIDLFLTSVDCLRDVLSVLQNGEEPNSQESQRLKQQFEAILTEDETVEPGSVAEESTETVAEVPASVTQHNVAGDDIVWQIQFTPGADVLKTGNDVVRMFSELEALGTLAVNVNSENLPALSAMDPAQSYLSWILTLTTPGEFQSPVSGAKNQAAIEEIFEWVVDESDLHIQQIDASAAGEVTQRSAGTGHWLISFVPHEDIYRTGNDPSRMFALLEELGDLSVAVDIDKLPEFGNLTPETCYLSWQLTLEESQGSITQSAIDEVFEWVADEADITLTYIGVDNAEADSPVEGTSAALPDVVSANEICQPETVADTPVAQPPVAEVATAADKKVEAAKAVKTEKSPSKAPETTSIRVDIDKIDTLINMVGELVITQSMLGQLGSEFEVEKLPKLLEGLGQLEQNTRELQESVMRIRMLPISFAFSRFPRMVRDLSKRLGKQINLEMIGETTELDKTVMEKIGDPLVHLVRNSVDHGIEMPAERVAAGKSAAGTVTLNAYHQGGNVVIEIVDDGRGLHREKILKKAQQSGLIGEVDASTLTNEQVYDLIFQPGFSTASEVSDVSGRGVGMDVVRKNILALNGTVEIQSTPSEGSKITIRLPLTLAILDGQLVKVGGETYIIPLISIIESLQSSGGAVNRVAGGCDVFQLRNEYVPIINLFDVFNVEPSSRILDDSLLVVVESEGEHVGLVVDELLGQQQVVIKSLEQNYSKVEGISGATILGDGTVALILDLPGIVKLAGYNHQKTKKVTTLAESHRVIKDDFPTGSVTLQ